MASNLLSRLLYTVVVLALVSVGSTCSGLATEQANLLTAPGPLREGANVGETYARGLAACLREKCWDAEVGQDSTGYFVDYTSPLEREGAQNKDASSCKKELGSNKPAPMSREELEILYDEQLSTKECLQAEGYDIEEPPSREIFVREQGAWIAYGSLDPNNDKSGDPEGWARINEKCPQP